MTNNSVKIFGENQDYSNCSKKTESEDDVRSLFEDSKVMISKIKENGNRHEVPDIRGRLTSVYQSVLKRLNRKFDGDTRVFIGLMSIISYIRSSVSEIAISLNFHN